MTVLKHEKSGLTVDVSGDVLKLYTKHGWNAVEESEATDPEVEAKADADAQAKAEAEAKAKAEAEAKAAADVKSEAGDADGSDAGEGDTSARQTTKRGTSTKG